MKAQLEKKGIMAGAKSSSPKEKLEIIDQAKRWSYYFSRRFRVQLTTEQTNTKHFLCVGHTGITLCTETQILITQTGAWRTELSTITKAPFTDVSLEQLRGNGHNQIVLPPAEKSKEPIVATTADAPIILMLVESYLMALEKDARYVLSTKPYHVRDATLLAFPTDVVIALSTKKMDKGWLFGSFDGKTGMFPADYVVPILGAPTMTSIDIARRQSVKKKQRRGSGHARFQTTLEVIPDDNKMASRLNADLPAELAKLASSEAGCPRTALASPFTSPRPLRGTPSSNPLPRAWTPATAAPTPDGLTFPGPP